MSSESQCFTVRNEVHKFHLGYTKMSIAELLSTRGCCIR